MDARSLDLGLLTWAVSQNKDAIPDNVKAAADEATTNPQFSKMEKMERLLKKHNEEERFLLMAAKEIFNA